jgi:site-specific DNA-cytosine methylase
MPRLLELFSGTGSIGNSFRNKGWDVISVDMNPKSDATIITDVETWDFARFEPGYFQCVWASPPCTHYSIARTTAKTPRDLEGSDRLVQRVLDIIGYHKPQGGFFY